MSLRYAMPHLRHVSSYALAAMLAGVLGTAPGLIAQQDAGSPSNTAPAQSGFSSSVGPLSYMGDALPAAPAPAAAAGGQSYGYDHHRSWANHLTFEAGGGFNAPIGNDTPFITWGGNVTVGAGLRFNPHFSGLIEYQFIDDKLPGSLVAQEGTNGGDAHIWSFTLAPVIDLFPHRKNDVYITGGGGFYRKVTNFTDPEQVVVCGYFCYGGTENVVVGHFSSNQGGANIGLGFTRKVSSDDRFKLYAEARYLWINTPGFNETNGLGTTELIPVTLGLRF